MWPLTLNGHLTKKIRHLKCTSLSVQTHLLKFNTTVKEWNCNLDLCVCVHRECFPDLCCSNSRPLSPPRDSRCSGGVKLRIKNRCVSVCVCEELDLLIFVFGCVCLRLYMWGKSSQLRKQNLIILLFSTGNRKWTCFLQEEEVQRWIWVYGSLSVT